MVYHQPGMYSLRLIGYLEEYPGVQKYEVFTVEVTACEAQLIATFAQQTMVDQINLWGEPFITYDISNAIAQYT